MVGSLLDASNYRGIAKLSANPKLFEKLITDIISHKVEPILCPYQQDFRTGLSAIFSRSTPLSNFNARQILC